LVLKDGRSSIAADEVVSILTSCKQLTSLALYYCIEQPEFDALLTHAPQLTSFTCNCLSIEEDRSATPCSWKELVMKHQSFDAETLAGIPTASLTRLAFGSRVFPSPSYPDLSFTCSEEPEVVHRSLLNLMQCPAWQQCGPAVSVWLELGERWVVSHQSCSAWYVL
jgi:hypothetical protein